MSKRKPYLTRREREILILITEGLSNKEIALKLVISIHTVQNHTRNLYGKLSARNRADAVHKGWAFVQ